MSDNNNTPTPKEWVERDPIMRNRHIVCPIEKENWEDKFDRRFNENTLVSAHTDWTPDALKQFILNLLYQQRQELVESAKSKVRNASNTSTIYDHNDYVRLKDVLDLLENK